MKKSDTKKQREFFEKRRMQKRQNHLRPPSSPKEGNTVNMDLLTMFIVNQISFKKEHTGKPKIHQADLKGPHKSMSQRPLELPMSPCSPSALNLANSQSQCSPHIPGLKKRKSSLFEEYKFKVMSPLQECSLSLCSSASSVSSETYNLHPRLTPCISCPSPWTSSCTNAPQPEGVCEYDPCTARSFQTQTPQPSPPMGVQFGSSLHSTETNMPFMESEYLQKPIEKHKHQEESLFLEFSCEKFRPEDIFSKRTHRIHLQKETPTTLLTAAHELCSTDHNGDFSPQQIHRRDDCRSCGIHTIDTKNTSESPPYCSLREGCASSDDEEGREQCIRTSAPLMRICQCQHSPESPFWSVMSATSSLSPVGPFRQQTDATNAGIYDKASLRTQDTGTQTVANSTSASCDAVVQDSLLKAHKTNTSTELTARGTCNEGQPATTRWQTGYSCEGLLNGTRCAPAERHTGMWNTPWKMLPTRETKQQTHKAITGQESSCTPKNQACMKKLLSPLKSSHASAPESQENAAARGGRGGCEGHKQGRENPDPTRSVGGTEEHANGSGAKRGANWVSEETETLHEIANILLMLKYRNKHA
ncbi:uncharacterized protein redic1 [Brachyhypopomus gauderio]|uniref:uncharacterized protein redic1 n=1 Tax=Brachyhypopomus gauderio TaxID=698409 RepID=UPI0040418954